MSQPPSYEFEDDDAPKPERKKFIPGLESAAAPLAPIPAAPGAPPAAAVRKAPATAPGAAKSEAAQSPGAAKSPAPAASESDNPDLKPGSRKDLWNCPHCGTGNKPERTTCRACGKSPSDAKEIPAWKKPKVIAAVVGALVLLVVILVLLKPSLELKPPGASSVDRGIRRGSADQ